MLGLFAVLNLFVHLFPQSEGCSTICQRRGYWRSDEGEWGWGVVGEGSDASSVLEDLIGDRLGISGLWSPFFCFSYTPFILSVVINDYSLAFVCRMF